MRRSFSTIMAALSGFKKHGTTGGDIDSRCWSTGWRPSASRASPSTSPIALRHAAARFIVADTPGHEQYTRNMATGASNSDLAICWSTRARAAGADAAPCLYPLFAPGHPPCRAGGQQDGSGRLRRAPFPTISANHLRNSPKSSRIFNIVADSHFGALRRQRRSRSARTCPGIGGLPLLEHLETVAVGEQPGAAPLRLPVQYVKPAESRFPRFTPERW
jgi:bifunctional enzyme CysN/CysC